MSSLSQRLKQIQVPVETQKADFSHLSLQQLEETKITFGHTHVGKTFREMWLNHQDWILWFSGRFEKSGKEEHQKVLHYINLMVERAERTVSTVPATKGAAPAQVGPVAKAKVVPRKPRPMSEALSA